MKENDKLTPCPFCGGKAITEESKFGLNVIHCESCGERTIVLHMDNAIVKAWNSRNDLSKTEQIIPEISLDGTHPDLINGLLEAKRNYPEKQDSSKEIPLAPKWSV